MKPFMSFFDPKTMDAPFLPTVVELFESNIYREVECRIKQVRSSQNLSTKIRKNQYTTRILQMQLDYFEDMQCERYSLEDSLKVN